MRIITYILSLLFCIFLVSCSPVSKVSSSLQTLPPVVTPPATAPNQATVEFSTIEVQKKYYSNGGSFAELDLKLPMLAGNYDGIPEINKFFVDKEKFFLDELPLDTLQAAEEDGKKVEGKSDGFYRQAHYYLEAQFGDIISVSAALDGGAGGVGWEGIEGDTFNLSTGKKLSLSDIFEVDEDIYMSCIYDLISEKINDDINESLKAGYGSPFCFDDAYSGNGYKSIREFDPYDFYLTETSLVIFYQKYVLADGASGPQMFEIPYEAILNMLKIDVKILP